MGRKIEYNIGHKIGSVAYWGEYSFGENIVSNKRYVKLKCSCGNVFVKRFDMFCSGKIKGCGCQKPFAAGITKTPEYKTWAGMKSRCNNPNRKDYLKYGGVGIKVCERWLKFENFLKDMGKKPSPSHSLDRFPNGKGNYEPTNCRWATPKEQNDNRKHVGKYFFNGKILTLKELSKEVKIGRKTLAHRLRNYGWSLEKATTTPVKPNGRKPKHLFIPHSFGYIN